ncbi:MAG TPA: HD-GYP domain-containing protein [Burkholderiales bacterium]
MRKKIDVRYLRLGMYVAELDRPWLGTPFLFQGFEIRSPAEIEELRRYCRHVYIQVPETDKEPAPRRAAVQQQPTYPTDAEQRLARDFLKIINQPRPQPVYADQVTLEQEIPVAREHYVAARLLLEQTIEDVRTGRSPDAAGARRVVAQLADSVIRNPDALTCFTQLKNKDQYTAQHSLRVCILALAFGRHLGFDRPTLETLGIGALLHDIGKLKVPGELLNKPGALTEQEFVVMQTHVPRGVEILERLAHIPRPAIEVARCHHERYSGGGYSAGLRGDEIGLFGMIGGIVDCYDAVTSDRPYRAGLAAHAALKQLYDLRGRDFHPGLVEQFIQCMGIYPIGSVVELNTGEVGVVIAMNRVRRLKPRVTLVLNPQCVPYGTPVTVDLMHRQGPDGGPCDIERVLEPGAYGIDPVSYLPVLATGHAPGSAARGTAPD